MPNISVRAFTGKMRRGRLMTLKRIIKSIEIMDADANAHNAAGKLPSRALFVTSNVQGSWTAIKNRIEGAIRQLQIQ